jgi:hypothetical protein
MDTREHAHACAAAGRRARGLLRCRSDAASATSFSDSFVAHDAFRDAPPHRSGAVKFDWPARTKPLADESSCVMISSCANLPRSCRMSLQAHLAELERRHKTLELEIEKESIHPAADEAHLHELKKKKLRLKDEIAKLKAEDETIH